MKKVGYLNLKVSEDYSMEQSIELDKIGFDSLIFEEKNLMNLENNTELVIYEIKSLGKTIIQLQIFFSYLKERNIRLTIASKNETSEKNKLFYDYIDIVDELVEVERFVISHLTTKGILLAKQSGCIVGRPKISQETISKIQRLNQNNDYSFREIADKCGVSLGTAYKYANLFYKEK